MKNAKSMRNKLSIPTVKSNASSLHTSVYNFCKQRFPLYTILQEQPIAVSDGGLKETLFIDIFIKELNLAIEANGRQHYVSNGFFYGGSFDFKKAKKRDLLKTEYLKKNGIRLVIFKFDDKLNYDFFNKKIDEILTEEL